MRILAIDTATASWSVALVDCDRLLAEFSGLRRETHSMHLMGTVHALLEVAQAKIQSVQGFAVTVGPGSFTGLRIGISTLKGLATALDKPCVGVSTLEALACQFPHVPHPIWSVLDARKGQVYAARFRWSRGGLVKEVTERAVLPSEWVCELGGTSLFVGEGAQVYRQVIEARLGREACFAPHWQNHIRASSVAWLAGRRFLHQTTLPPELLAPSYLREPDAEWNTQGPALQAAR